MQPGLLERDDQRGAGEQANSQRRAAVSAVTQLITTPQRASTTISPVHDQDCCNTVSGDVASGTRASVVLEIPVAVEVAAGQRRRRSAAPP